MMLEHVKCIKNLFLSSELTPQLLGSVEMEMHGISAGYLRALMQSWPVLPSPPLGRCSRYFIYHTN